MNVRHAAIAVFVLALVGAGVVAQEQQDTTRPRGPVVGRSVVATTLGIVAASQPLAARAGVQILERGGNAIDAAIAANATIGLMEPTGNGIGGDLFILYYEAKTGTVHGLNSSGWAPSALTRRVPRREGHHEDAAARHPLGDRAGRGRRMGGHARPVRHQAVLRAPRARHLLRRERVPAVGEHRGRLGAVGEDAQRAPELAEDLPRRRHARAEGGRGLPQPRPRGVATPDRARKGATATTRGRPPRPS